MEDYFKIVTPHLHSELVSPEAMSRIQALAQILPPFSISMLEVRLGAVQPQVDLSVFFRCRPLNLPEKFLSHPVWQAFQNSCREWVEPTSFLHRSVQDMSLEFDLDRQPSQQPIPCIFYNLNRETVRDAQALINVALQLPSYSVSSKLQSNLRLCVDSLPDSARITHIGAMLSRPVQPVRISVDGIPLEYLSDYLRRIGWTDSTNNLSSLLATRSDFGDEMGLLLHLDVSDTVLPKIGVDFYLKQQLRPALQWQSFLHHLVERGLCTPAKQTALLAWPGFSQKADQPELWPTNLTGGDIFLGSKVCSVFWRIIDHIKIVYQPGTPLAAKGYLGFGHRWFDASAPTFSLV